MAKKEENLHAGHRERVREKFIADGNLDGYALHNILELLLFYTIPRADTNELAHKLINHFGSFSGVLNASVSDLTKVDGVGKTTAVFLSMLPHVFKRYTEDVVQFSGKANNGQLGEYISNKFIGETVEKVLIVSLDNRMRVLSSEFISEGYVDYTTVDMRSMLDHLIRYKATCAIIAHNHPRGFAFPSQDDINTTTAIKKALEVINVRLLDHIIVASDDYISLASSTKFRNLF